MIHVRQQIREAVKVRLMQMDPTMPVYLGRRYPFMPAELPAIALYSQRVTNNPTEQSRILTMGGPQNRRLGREMMLFMDIVATESEDVEEVLDRVGAQIEEAIDTDVFLTTEGVRLTKDMWLATSDLFAATLQSGTPETPIGVLRLGYTIAYQTLTGTPHRAA